MKFKAPEIPRNFLHNLRNVRRKEGSWRYVVDALVSRLSSQNKSSIAPQPPPKKLIKELKIQRPRVVRSVSGKCVQKFVLDWRIDNLEFLMSYCRESNVNWNQCSSPVTILSELFLAGKEIQRETTWGLQLKSHYGHKGTFYFSLHLYLHEIVNGSKNEKSIKASFVLHSIGENDQIFSSKQAKNLVFEPTKDRSEPLRLYHGWNDFLSFMDVNNPENKLTLNNSLHFRLELYISSRVQPTEIACPGKSYSQIQHGLSLKKFTTENYIGQHRGESLEVVACNHSFYVDAHYLEQYPKLKALCADDKACGNCGVISIPCYSDNAVRVMLSFIVGDFTQYMTKMEEALEILRISQEFDLAALMYDTWLNVLHLLRLEHIPMIIVFSHHFKAPEFVNNYVCVLLFMFLYELRQLKVYHYWLSKEPLAFTSIFLPDKDTSSKEAQNSQQSSEFTKHYFRHEFRRLSRLETSNTVTSMGDADRSFQGASVLESSRDGEDDDDEDAVRTLAEVFLDDAIKAPTDVGHDNACKCHLCRQTNAFCRERLLIDYLAKVKLIQSSRQRQK